MLLVPEINEIFTVKDKNDGKIYKVKTIKNDADNCKTCIFNSKEFCRQIICCIPDRPDKENVYFKYVEL